MTDVFAVPVSLEDLDQKLSSGAKGSDGEGKRGLRQVQRASDIDGGIAADPRRHVAYYDIRRAAEPLEEERLDLRLAKIASQDFDSGERRDGHEIDRDHPPGRAAALSGDLRPPTRRGSQVHDDVPLPEEAIAEVDLGELDRGPAAVRLLLRGAVEPVVPAGFDPRFAHWAERCRRDAIILSSAAGLGPRIEVTRHTDQGRRLLK